ncbi:MAG: hypothetical protein ACOY4U_11355 [Pseudomonadota bacterium]
MFKVSVYRKLHLGPSDSKRLMLRRELNLPFVPFIGLNLTDGVWYGPPIVEVTWSTSSNEFSCMLEPYFASKHGDMTVQEVDDWAADEGWVLNGQAVE